MISRWPTVTLEKIIDSERSITYGVVKPGEICPGGVKLIRGGDIFNGLIAIDLLRTISPELSKQYRRTILKGGELIISLVGNPGEVAVVPKELSGANLARQVGLIPLGSQVITKYVMYFFMSHWGKAALGAETTGAVQKVINLADLKRIKIPLPSINEQRCIASILSAYDELIENNTRRIKILEEVVRHTHKEWFINFRFPGYEIAKIIDSDSGLIPEGWNFANLAELADDIRDSVIPETVDNDVPYVGLEHMPRRSIALSEWGKPSDVQSTKLRFKEDDILFGKIRPYFHKISVAPVAGISSTDAMIIRPKSSDDYAMVLATVSSDAFVMHAVQTSNGTKMPRTSWSVLQNYPIPVPPDYLKKLFQTMVLDVLASIKNYVMQNRNLRDARDLLIPKLISGELDVSSLPLLDNIGAVTPTFEASPA